MGLVTHGMKRALVTCVACVIASCSSSQAGDDFADPQLPGRDVNPEGVPYPTDHLGGHARAGKNAGDRIPKFTFQAYVDGDHAAGLKTISLADYYDPQSLHHRVLHLEVAATWCGVCSAYADATVKTKEPLGQEGIVYLEVIVAGPRSTSGPSLADVDGWVKTHNSNFTTAIDVRGMRLSGIGVPPQTMPWDVMIDTRSMEILDSTAGAPIDLVAYDRSYLALVAKRPPPY
ncbi:hypothetical protein BH11MYX4_BH11MYX4_56350 [soil metagenome]